MSIFLKYYKKPWFFKQWETPQVQKVKKAVLRISKSPPLFVVPSTNENEYSRTLQHTMSSPARASGSPTELLFVVPIETVALST